MRVLTFKIDSETFRQLEELEEILGECRSEVIRRAIRYYWVSVVRGNGGSGIRVRRVVLR